MSMLRVSKIVPPKKTIIKDISLSFFPGAKIGLLQLGSARFIAGDAYGIADITALCAMDFMRPARITRPPELKNVERWYNEVSARPSAKA